MVDDGKLRVLDLFSGIGGFSLGLKRAGGFRTVAYCEIESYCQEVLQARMRDGSLDTAPICTDIRRLDGRPWRGRVDLICGGFPCQDISNAGNRVGIAGERSGLWSELHRLICEIRPRFVFVENVAALLARGMERVLGDLAESGYDAEWDVVPASAVGAPHRRERVWIVAYPVPAGERRLSRKGEAQANALAYSRIFESEQRHRPAMFGRRKIEAKQAGLGGSGGDEELPNTILERLEGLVEGGAEERSVDRSGHGLYSPWWEVEPAVGRVANGVPHRVDRLAALGNAVVPQVVEWIGRKIVSHETEHLTNGPSET